MPMPLQHSIVGVNPNWETPQSLFDEACTLYNVAPSLDVCATRQNKKCTSFFSKRDNALGKPWTKSFYMNPPYGRKMDVWIEYAYEQHKKHNVTGMALVFSKTETQWWHNFVQDKAEVHFIKGRVRYEMGGCPSKNTAPYGSCWIIWRKKK